jgi:hypothetical protein
MIVDAVQNAYETAVQAKAAGQEEVTARATVRGCAWIF